MNENVLEQIVSTNSLYRSLVAKGEAKDKVCGYAPKAARMLKMVRMTIFHWHREYRQIC